MGEAKTIYISLSCLGIDQELIKTIDWCFNYAEHPENLRIGIACIGNKDFYDFIKDGTSRYKNVKVSYSPIRNEGDASPKGNLGVGYGRNSAAEMYNNEDYFLQIDTHTFFAQNWDSYLINKFEEAVKYTNNNKTILTGYLGDYGYDPEDIEYILADDVLNYTKWKPNEFHYDTLIPSWTSFPIEEISSDLKNQVEKNFFVPASKISAHFMFGNKFFGTNICLPKDLLFWEEEIIQTIELIDNGFSLVHPGEYSPMNHFYSKPTVDILPRQMWLEFLNQVMISYEHAMLAMNINYKSYIAKNSDKVKKFEEYSGISVIDGAPNDTTYAKTFSNI